MRGDGWQRWPGRRRVLWGAGSVVLAIWLTTLIPLHLPEPVVPTRIVGRPREIAPGPDVRASDLLRRLEQLRYREIPGRNPRPGEYRAARRQVLLNRRAFVTPDARVPASQFEIRLDWRGRISAIRDAEGQPVASLLLDPEGLTICSWFRPSPIGSVPPSARSKFGLMPAFCNVCRAPIGKAGADNAFTMLARFRSQH